VKAKVTTGETRGKAAEEEPEKAAPETSFLDQGVLERGRSLLERARRAQGFLGATRPVDLTTRDLVDFLRLLVVPTLRPAATSDPLLWLAASELLALAAKLEGLDTHPNRREEIESAERKFMRREPRATVNFPNGEVWVDLGKIAPPVTDRTYADELTDLFLANANDKKFSDVEKRVVAWAERMKVKLPKLAIDLAKVRRQLAHHRRHGALKATREEAQKFAVLFLSKVGMKRTDAKNLMKGADAQAESRARKKFAGEVALLLIVDDKLGRFKVADVAEALLALVGLRLAQDANRTSLSAKLRQLDVEKLRERLRLCAEDPLKSSQQDAWLFARVLFVEAGMREDDATSLLSATRNRTAPRKRTGKPRG